ncbi:hypothetical protein [Succinimonas sp.]|uniref:hypothetical protein n=1 Tax=Succinimonas sp. TaxID=1936151 RepID=UPI003865D7A6
MNIITAEEQHFHCFGISHRFAGAEIRGKFAMDLQQRRRMLSLLRSESRISGAVALSTCNRTEFFLSSSFPAEQIFMRMEELIAQFAGCSVQDVRCCFVRYSGKKAVRHLLRIGAGIDSLTVGESEILGQARSAYQLSLELGMTDGILNIIFQNALHYAKIIRGFSCFSCTALSYGTLVANEISRLGLEAPRILLLGSTGQIGSLVLRTLLSRSGFQICAAERRYPVRISHPRLTTVDYERRYEIMADFDVVISATSSPHYTVTCRDLCAQSGFVYADARQDPGRSALFIDLSVPCDLDPDIADLKNCRLLDFSYFENLVKLHQSVRASGALQAGGRIEDYADEILRKIEVRRCFRSFREPGSEIERYSGRDLFFLMQNAASAEELLILHRLYHKAVRSSRIGKRIAAGGNEE